MASSYLNLYLIVSRIVPKTSFVKRYDDVVTRRQNTKKEG